VTAVVEVTTDMMPGVVSLPHGWGHDREGLRLGIATLHAGVNVNVVSDASAVDPVSGNAAFNGLPVTLQALH
jgi:anaerobic selenocysteine-containing dehydrogenase